MNEKKRGPKRGAAKRWAKRLKQIREQSPPAELVRILNEAEKIKNSALSVAPSEDLDI